MPDLQPVSAITATATDDLRRDPTEEGPREKATSEIVEAMLAACDLYVDSAGQPYCDVVGLSEPRAVGDYGVPTAQAPIRVRSSEFIEHLQTVFYKNFSDIAKPALLKAIQQLAAVRAKRVVRSGPAGDDPLIAILIEVLSQDRKRKWLATQLMNELNSYCFRNAYWVLKAIDLPTSAQSLGKLLAARQHMLRSAGVTYEYRHTKRGSQYSFKLLKPKGAAANQSSDAVSEIDAALLLGLDSDTAPPVTGDR
jgi:hypothetical protein